jgi:hypothetical protein
VAKKRVFIIYGRDTEAHDELVKFIRAVGLEEIPFESIANSLGASPFVADVVSEGMNQADALVALFTPDEQAALYDPLTGNFQTGEGDSRWQARPNVLFEAGVAYGLGSKKEPILAVLGADIRLFSDMAGRHFVQLAAPDGKRNLYKRLENLVGRLRPIVPDWEASTSAGDFSQCVRQRWRYFDEINELLRFFVNRKVRSKKQMVSLFEIVQAVVAAEPHRDWSAIDPRDFMEAVKQRFGEAATNHAYWWFVVYGFFRFNDIECWGVSDDATWDDSVDEARLAPRGAALLDRLRILRPRLRRARNTKVDPGPRRRR